MKRFVIAWALALVAALLVAACVGGQFDPQSKVDSVRLFASRADKPYARPGEIVNIDVLATDARKDKTRPLKILWVPFICMNPRDDLYYLCFAPPEVRGDGGAILPTFDAGTSDASVNIPTDGTLFRPGIDLSDLLPSGPRFSFTMPLDAIQPRRTTKTPYGLAIAFAIACAGRVETVERDEEGGPQQVPIACFDENNQKLPPSDYVLGITRVYAYDTRVNNNPVIDGATFDGKPVDPAVGISVDRCTAAKKEDCPKLKLNVSVPATSWEIQEEAFDADGNPLREQIWVTYYASTGQMGSDARLLYDTTGGAIEGSDVEYQASQVYEDGHIWAVVHDNRGGAEWVDFPVHVK